MKEWEGQKHICDGPKSKDSQSRSNKHYSMSNGLLPKFLLD